MCPSYQPLPRQVFQPRLLQVALMLHHDKIRDHVPVLHASAQPDADVVRAPVRIVVGLLHLCDARLALWLASHTSPFSLASQIGMVISSSLASSNGASGSWICDFGIHKNSPLSMSTT